MLEERLAQLEELLRTTHRPDGQAPLYIGDSSPKPSRTNESLDPALDLEANTIDSMLDFRSEQLQTNMHMLRCSSQEDTSGKEISQEIWRELEPGKVVQHSYCTPTENPPYAISKTGVLGFASRVRLPSGPGLSLASKSSSLTVCSEHRRNSIMAPTPVSPDL